MLDDDFKAIEEFLKVDGNTELQHFQQFDKIVSDLVATKLKESKNIKETFTNFNELVYHSYSEYNKYNNDILKDFAITITVVKQLLVILQTVNNNVVFDEEGKKIYITLIKTLVNILKDESQSHLNFFTTFSEYLDGINHMLSLED
jgi:hypothetical protein